MLESKLLEWLYLLEGPTPSVDNCWLLLFFANRQTTRPWENSKKNRGSPPHLRSDFLRMLGFFCILVRSAVSKVASICGNWMWVGLRSVRGFCLLRIPRSNSSSLTSASVNPHSVCLLPFRRAKKTIKLRNSIGISNFLGEKWLWVIVYVFHIPILCINNIYYR